MLYRNLPQGTSPFTHRFLQQSLDALVGIEPLLAAHQHINGTDVGMCVQQCLDEHSAQKASAAGDEDIFVGKELGYGEGGA